MPCGSCHRWVVCPGYSLRKRRPQVIRCRLCPTIACGGPRWFHCHWRVCTESELLCLCYSLQTAADRPIASAVHHVLSTVALFTFEHRVMRCRFEAGVDS